MGFSRRIFHAVVLALLTALLAPSTLSAQEPEAFQALKWRHVGPIVGGRGTSVFGHPTDKQVFYYGHSSGGLWKTEDGGHYWEPLSDGQFAMASVGAFALAQSDPDVIFVGMGEPQQRDSVSWGNGIYKSTDGGVTFEHLGLEETRSISRVRIHPENPDIVYVSAMGNAFGPDQHRGIYKTTDGGKTWEQIFFKADNAGVIDLVLDPTNPDVLYAASFQIQRRTWQVWVGGDNSGLFKSTDGGKTWTDITRNPGLPQTGQLGRIGLAHSPAMPDRITALVDSEEKSGVYQSDDGGAHWQLISDDVNITVRPFYFYHLYASPVNPDELWTLTNKLWQSLDGGKTWTQRSGTKDDFHDMWMDPEDPNRMIITHDGGTQVTLTGGKTWTGVYTHGVAQGYRLHIDNEFPYRLYSAFQDLICYRVPSASVWGGISMNDVKILGTGESGSCVPQPGNPDIVMHTAQSSMAAGGGPIQRINLKTEQYEQVNVWPMSTFGMGQKDARYRFNWHHPIEFDPHKQNVVYTAAEVVFRSDDLGQSWDVISPVLTFDDESKQQLGGAPWMPESSGQEAYNTIHRLVVSEHEQGVIYTGSDDGRLHVTRDGGKTWNDISAEWPEWSDIYEIAISPHDPGTVYVAISRYRTANDFRPYLYKFTDYGAKWEKISDNFPQSEITRTIVEDTARQGLLFAGTETGVFVSFDDGKEWRRMNLNLPAVPVHAMKVKHEDLVITTHGRGFWIMDDISPLRQWEAMLAKAKYHLFKPRTAIRLGRNWWAAYGGGVFGGQKNYFVQNQRPGHTFIEKGVVNGIRERHFLNAGQARPDGVIIYYLLSDQVKDVSLDILDAEGKVIKSFSDEAIGQGTFKTMDGRGYGRVSPAGDSGEISIASGLNRFVWDMNYPDATQIPGRPPAGMVRMAKPGMYQVRLNVSGESQTQQFELKINPSETWTKEDTDARFELWTKIYEVADVANQWIIASRQTLADLKESGASADRIAEAEAAQVAFESAVVPVGRTLVQIANEPAKLISRLGTVHQVIWSSEGRPPESAYLAADELTRAINEKIEVWRETAASLTD